MRSLHKAFLALGMLSMAGLAQAAPITLQGDRFSVTLDDAQISPYSGVALSGSQDTVYFESTTFTALSSDPVDPRIVLQMTLTVDPGYAFAGLTFTERGSYYLFGDGTVDVTTRVTVGDPATPDALLDLAASSLNQTRALTPWELTGVLPAPGQGTPQPLLITLDTTLGADASTGLAVMRNFYAGFQIRTEAAAVPEPSSWTLLLAGVLAAMLAGRRARGARPLPVCRNGTGRAKSGIQ